MAKKKVQEMSTKQKISKVWSDNWKLYCEMWKASWEQYKTLIGPFIKGSFEYLWNLVYGTLSCLGKSIKDTLSIICEWVIALVQKA